MKGLEMYSKKYLLLIFTLVLSGATEAKCLSEESDILSECRHTREGDNWCKDNRVGKPYSYDNKCLSNINVKKNSASMSFLKPYKPDSNFKSAGLKFSSGKYLEALLDFKKMANDGNLDAQIFLSIIYSHGVIFSKTLNKEAGKFIPYNEKLAVKWLKKAVDHGDPLSQYQLGVIYSEGKLGIKKDDKKAFKLYEKAAKQGERSSLYNIGNMYRQGRAGLKINYAKAIEYYKWSENASKALGGHHVDALYNIGFLYFQGGYGIKRNLDEAYKYFSISSGYGNEKALIGISMICQQSPQSCK
jgi:TPR repeat protein